MAYSIDKEALLTRFIRYVKTETRSDENQTDRVPSTDSQVVFAQSLAHELDELGLVDVFYNSKDGYVTACLPGNDSSHEYPTIGFIAHLDTADFNAKNVQPQIIDDYQGGEINLSDSGYQLSPKEFPSLNNYHGHTLITTDGRTLLGADDKSGIAEIMTAVAYLKDHPEIKHGPIKVAFGPDEEIGVGADRFDVDRFGADFAYTMDGGPLGELQYETFNAAAAKLEIKGKNVHPGTAKGQMINALQVAIDFHQSLPVDDRPEKTEGRQGFFHLLSLSGVVDEAQASYIIRDHDRDQFEARKQKFIDLVTAINDCYPSNVIEASVNDQYYNMGEIISQDMRPVSLAKQAMVDLAIEPVIQPVRGGTDGSKLTYMGLPTPNIFAGGENMHGRFEYVSLQVMCQACQVIIRIAELAGNYQDL
ncbi:peptidase T [Aerococcus urinaehominis]|uniref:Peptidase T n=1 Tax=Aerococcus urinaehominis TaxID=128944 RepID=A0A120IAQ8_9LACT|nr:peptidase T [Aerococcus urinaehominis]AMB98844.1 peptidase T [Aerococcus urinaehominis]SDM17504.1 tripeptide aminopeptidase [Aerococcus urinaehominis]